jgi:hypothetical protein
MFRLLLELLCIRKIKNLAEEWNVFWKKLLRFLGE